MKFEEYATAAKFRDLVTRIAEDTVERLRPRYRYATVKTIGTNTATVQFPGEDSEVTVGMGAIKPSAIGQRVRIHGVQGERYIADVLGRPALDPGTSAGLRGQYALTGGGFVQWNGSDLRWTQRFIAIAVGQGVHYTTNGHYNISMPADGTVIPGAGGTPSVTVHAGGVPIPAWGALYAIPTYGENSNSISAKGGNGFAVYQYNYDFVVPDHWILIAVRNNDNGRLKLGTGADLDYWRACVFENSWGNHNGTQGCQYRKSYDGFVEFRGLMAGGTTGVVCAIRMPEGFRARAYQHQPIRHSGGVGSIRVNGTITDGTGNGGLGAINPWEVANAWVDLSTLRYYADA